MDNSISSVMLVGMTIFETAIQSLILRLFSTKSELTQLLDKTSQEMWEIVRHLKPEKQMEQHFIQSFKMTSLDAMIHVIEHFTYHTGQIVYQTKSLNNIDMGFYKGINLD